ncbi:ABC transporter permease [Acidobacteriota bacterium]
MFRNYVKVTLRNIKKYTGFSLINILGLAIGIACCIMILLWVEDEISFDRFHENYNALYATIPQIEDAKYYSNPLAFAAIFKESFPEVIRTTRFYQRTMLTKYEDKIFNESGALVDDDFLKMFTFPLLKGNPDSVFASRDSIVISERMAVKYFGTTDPVGKSLLANNSTELIVTGIIENVPTHSHLQFDFLSPMRLMGERAVTSWSYEPRTYALLEKNVSLTDFQDKISGFIMEHDKRTNQTVTLSVLPISKIHLYSLNGTNPIVYVYIFLTIAIVILLIACINFINLSTARSNTRAKEIGMRKVVGAGKWDIIKQFIGESLILSFLSLFLAVGLVFLLLPAFNALAGKQLALNITGNISTLLGLIGITLFTGLVSGSYPALLLSSFKPVKTLKGAVQSGSGGYILRKLLVVCQFSTTIVLMIGTLVMYRQLHYIETMDLGLDKEHVVSIRMNSDLRKNYRSFKDEIRQHPSVVNVTSAWNQPTAIGRINPVYWEGRGPDQYVTINDASVDYDYFETFEMDILQGRGFSEEFGTDMGNYVLNEEAAKLTELESPLGKMFSVWEDEGQIIGIVKNFNTQSLHNEIGPVVFTLSQRHGSHSYIFVKIGPENVAGTLESLKGTAAKFAPNDLFRFTFLDDDVQSQYTQDRRRGTIYRYFTVLAIFVSCLGLFGMASFISEQRTKEIGIRKVLGASIFNIIEKVSKDFVILLALSNAVAWPIAYFVLSRMLNNYAYRTNIPLWIFVISGVIAFTIALLTICFKIIRAASANPVDSLRYE